MTDDELERQLRERLHSARLPDAPVSLRRRLDDLFAADLPARPRRRRGYILLAAATLVVAGVGAAGILSGGRLDQRADAPINAPDASPVAITTAEPSMIVPSGWVVFDAPGIRFAHPADWKPSDAFDNYPKLPGQRVIATFARGVTPCPNTEGVSPLPTKPPGGCDAVARKHGTLIVYVMELVGQLPPRPDAYGDPTMFAGYRAWTRGPYEQDDPALLMWWVAGPDNGIYQVSASVPLDDVGDVRAEVGGALETLQLTSWRPVPEAVGGWVHLDLDGFSFDYPEGWVVYYPQDWWMTGSSVVTVSSRPLKPPCDGDPCQRFTTPPDTVVVEFSIGAGPMAPDWSKAPLTIGGQPATVTDWGPSNATSADEGKSWNVRFDDRRTLEIGASLSGPDLPAKRKVLADIIARVSVAADNQAP